MSEFKVELSGDDINRSIADAITASVLGDTIKKLVREAVDLATRYDSPVKEILQRLIRDEMMRELGTYQDKIREHVRVILTDQMIDKVIATTLEKLTREY